MSITDATPGAVIYYTCDGETPTTSSNLYTGPITVSSSEVLIAIAVAPGFTQSAVRSETYTITPPVAPITETPSLSPVPGSYSPSVTVTISDKTPGATIFYTADGTTPTTSSTPYTGPLTVASSEQIKTFAVAPGYKDSPVASGAYVVEPVTPPCPTTAPGYICTIAGNGVAGYNQDGIAGMDAELSFMESVRADSIGNVYIADTGNNRIRKLTPSGTIFTIAGSGVAGYTGEGGAATQAELTRPGDMVLDASGNIYVTDSGNNVIRRIDPAGVITTIAGTGVPGYSGDGGPGKSAMLKGPATIAMDARGNIYFSDQGTDGLGGIVVRKLDSTGNILTIAGNGMAGAAGDGGQAVDAEFESITELALDAAGDLLISDGATNSIRSIAPSGIISTIVGTGTAGFSGDGGPAVKAELRGPTGVEVDGNGNIFISDGGNNCIRMVTPSGIISTLAGTGAAGFSGDGGPAGAAAFYQPVDVKVDPHGNLYIADFINQRVRKVNATAAMAPVFTPSGGTYASAQSVKMASATTGASIYYTLDGSIPTVASTLYTGPVTVSNSETVNAIAVFNGLNDSPVVSAAYTIAPVVQAGMPVTATPVFSIREGPYPVNFIVAISDSTPGAMIYYTINGPPPTTSSTPYTGPVPVSNTEAFRAIAVAPGYSESLTAFATYWIEAATPTFAPAAGTYTGTQEISISDASPRVAIYYTTDNSNPTVSSRLYTGPVTVSSSETIQAIAVGTSYVNSSVAVANYVIDPVPGVCPSLSPGVICTIAGTGIAGYNGDGGSALTSQLSAVQSVRVDGAGNVYFADTGNDRIRKMTTAGIVSTIAGSGAAGYGGDNGPATTAKLNSPTSIALDNAGDIFIADTGNNRIRMVTPAGIISTFAGNGTPGESGDGGMAVSARLSSPSAIAVDELGDVYFADQENVANNTATIRRVDITGLITTVAQTHYVSGMTLDPSGDLIIAEGISNQVRMVTPSLAINPVAGTGVAGFSGDGGPATQAALSHPTGVDVDPNGNIYIADTANVRIRMVNAAGVISTTVGTGVSGFSGDGALALNARLAGPSDVKFDTLGNVYIADQSNERIRKVNSGTVLPPTFTPAAGAYATAQSVTISSLTPGATIYYTTDGSTPTTASTLYTGPVNVSASETIEAVAVANGLANSKVVTAAYNIQPKGSFSNLVVPGTSVIFDPDQVLSPSALSALQGSTLPATPAVLALQFASQPGLTLTFSATGQIAYHYTLDVIADGVPATFLCAPMGSISGYMGASSWPLVGVFTNGAPTGPAPAPIDYVTLGNSQPSYSPQLNQVFFIGDGLTGTRTGTPQIFHVPDGATEIWLGIADVLYYDGPIGDYGDNPGRFTVSGVLQ